MSLLENYLISFHCIPHSLIMATSSERTGHTNPIWLPVVKKDYSARDGALKGDSWVEVIGSWIWKRCWLSYDALSTWTSDSQSWVMAHIGIWHHKPLRTTYRTGEWFCLYKPNWNQRPSRTKVTLMHIFFLSGIQPLCLYMSVGVSVECLMLKVILKDW